MFSKETGGMTLAGDIANRLFDNITASDYGRDQTCTATLRAVLHKRLPAGESLRLSLVPLAFTADTVNAPAAIMREITKGIGQKETTYAIFILYPQDDQAGAMLLDAVGASFGDAGFTGESLEPRQDLRLFYVRMLNGLFYSDGRVTLIFLDSLDTRKLHALQMMIPKYLPKLFADQPLSGCVFLCVDNIELRREIAAANKDNPYVRAMFDFRTRLTDAQHYAADWSDMKMVGDFLRSMDFTHEEAVAETPVSACNLPLSVAPAIRVICSLGVANFINFVKGGSPRKFIQADAFRFTLDAF